MPYIEKSQRTKFNKILSQLPEMENKGELEYCIFYLMRRYMSTKPEKYSNLHDTTYAAFHCGDEYLRLYLDKRENDARDLNGDIIGQERE